MDRLQPSAADEIATIVASAAKQPLRDAAFLETTYRDARNNVTHYYE